MALKRSQPDTDGPVNRPRRQDAKRTKLSPTAPDRDLNSSESSICSVSEDSVALHSSPPASEHTRKTSLSSLQSYRSEPNFTSESSMSSNESVADSDSEREGDDDDAEEDNIVTIGGPKKPAMSQRDWSGGAQELRSRLDALLPRLAASNEMLEGGEGGGGSMEDVEEGEQHIEMNLGLGVLEEQKEENEEAIKKSSHDEDDAAERQYLEDGDTNAMNELLGQSSTSSKASIQDMG